MIHAGIALLVFGGILFFVARMIADQAGPFVYLLGILPMMLSGWFLYGSLRAAQIPDRIVQARVVEIAPSGLSNLPWLLRASYTDPATGKAHDYDKMLRLNPKLFISGDRVPVVLGTDDPAEGAIDERALGEDHRDAPPTDLGGWARASAKAVPQFGGAEWILLGLVALPGLALAVAGAWFLLVSGIGQGNPQGLIQGLVLSLMAAPLLWLGTIGARGTIRAELCNEYLAVHAVRGEATVAAIEKTRTTGRYAADWFHVVAKIGDKVFVSGDLAEAPALPKGKVVVRYDPANPRIYAMELP